MTRYNPILVALHWLTAALLIGWLAMGFFVLAATANSDPIKIDILRWHMAGGMGILALTVIRLLVRVLTKKPPEAPTGTALFDRLAPVSHWGLYLLIVAMATTGFKLGWDAGLPAIVFANSGEPLPESFLIFPMRIAHGYIGGTLVALIALHFAAALYHQYFVKDDLFRRMWFGRR